DDCDNLAHVRARGWYLTSRHGKPYKTRKVGGACIFDNRVGGRTGQPGCAFHHLAARKGLHHSDTKPHICWSIPLNFSSEEPEEPGGRTTTIVSAFTADAWGGTDDAEEPDGRGHVGFWCVDTPDAYRGASPVYRSLEHELRKGMGDAAPLELVLYPVAIHYKGSGFYTTDYGKAKAKKEGGEAGGSSSDSSSSSTSDSKPAEKKKPAPSSGE